MTLITTLIFKSFPNWNDVGSQCYFKPRGKIEQDFEEFIVPREKDNLHSNIVKVLL